MSDQIEAKLRPVVVARYHYRHEAEFAAGLLEDAGIPYRLQVDDMVMPMSVTPPALLWVRSVDLTRACDILDLPSASDPTGGATGPDA
jgi:hypothetical protein